LLVFSPIPFFFFLPSSPKLTVSFSSARMQAIQRGECEHDDDFGGEMRSLSHGKRGWAGINHGKVGGLPSAVLLLVVLVGHGSPKSDDGDVDEA